MNAPHRFDAPLGLGGEDDLQKRRDGFAIGQILVDAGYLDIDAAETVARAQRQNGLSFGETALRLKMIQPSAIEFALAQQFEYPYLEQRNHETVAPTVVTAFQTSGVFAEQMRSLRTRLMMFRVANPSVRPCIVVTSAMHGEGRSFVAANLAVVFAQLGERTLLIDADMRSPSQHALFNLPRIGLSNFLMGRAGLECIAKVPKFFDLSVLPAGSKPPNPQELLAKARMDRLLQDALSVSDVIIIDTPPISVYSDALILASLAGMSLMVARTSKTNQREFHRARTALMNCNANIVGGILNDN